MMSVIKTSEQVLVCMRVHRGQKFSTFPMPVSYTHLDVYKRQLLYRASLFDLGSMPLTLQFSSWLVTPWPKSVIKLPYQSDCLTLLLVVTFYEQVSFTKSAYWSFNEYISKIKPLDNVLTIFHFPLLFVL